MTITSRKQRKGRIQVFSVLDYLKGTGVPCNITLYCRDEDCEQTIGRGVHINLNKIPRKIIKGKTNYFLKVLVDNKDRYRFYFYSYLPDLNKSTIYDIEKVMNNKYWESMTNHKRKTKLDDILSDNTPLTLI